MDGYTFAMAGGTDHHNRIPSRLDWLVFDTAEAARCELFIADMILKTHSRKGYSLDLFLTYQEVSDGSHFKQFPHWIAEVLTDSTETIDRGKKLQNYTAIPTLQGYLLVSQDRAFVKVFERLEDNT